MPGVKLLTMNRPDRLNAISTEMIESFHAALDQIAGDSTCRAVVLTGAGRAFCSGADLRGGADFAPIEGPPLGTSAFYPAQRRIADIVSRLRHLDAPVVAAVNGVAAGGGMSLAVAADVRVASTTAAFSVANVKLGLSGGEMGLSFLLPRLIGLGRATEMLLTGRTMESAEALAAGLATAVVEPQALLDTALATAAAIATNPRLGVLLTKEMLDYTANASSLDQALILENRTQTVAACSGDVQEALAAFRKREKPPVQTN